MKTNKKIIQKSVVLGLLMVLLIVGFSPTLTYADDPPANTNKEDPCSSPTGTKSIPDTFSVGNCLKVTNPDGSTQKDRIPGKDGVEAGGKGITGVFLDGIDLFIKLIGSIALIVFIIGALLTVASEGKQDLLEKGKTAMIYAVIGIVVSMMSFIIVTFVQSILF